MVYLLPMLAIKIDKIGGPNVGFKPFLEASIVQSNNQNNNNINTKINNNNNKINNKNYKNNNCSIEASLNWGFAITLGAFINIEAFDYSIYSHQWGPLTIFNTKFPIEQGCITFPSRKLIFPTKKKFPLKK